MIFLDTNIVSDTMREKPADVVRRWLVRHDGVIALSTVLLAEIAYGIEGIQPGQRSPVLRAKFDFWRNHMAGRIYGFDEEAALVFGRIMGKSKLSGQLMATADGMIAAIALRHGASLATRNTKHFQIPGLLVINPWDDAP